MEPGARKSEHRIEYVRVDNVGERVAGTTQRGGGDNASFLHMNNVEHSARGGGGYKHEREPCKTVFATKGRLGNVNVLGNVEVMQSEFGGGPSSQQSLEI